MIKLKHPVILASNSPRRKELFEKLHIPFTIHTNFVEEHVPENIKPKQTALYLAVLKSEAFPTRPFKDHIIITADTVVLLDNKILGKPISKSEACNMLTNLSGKTHLVITGVCLRINNEVNSFMVSTKVTFGPLSKELINNYVNSGEAMDKAGAYGIQDWIGMVGIKKITGSHYNVMGLPVYELYQSLKQYLF